MRFAVTGGERTVEELVERLYRTESKRAAGRARRGLLDLNPELKEAADVAEGTAILVPDVEGAERVAEEEVSHGEIVSRVMADDFADALDTAVEHLERSIAEEKDDARRTVKRLRSGAVKAAAKDVPGAPARLKETLAGAEERLGEVEALELYRRQVLIPEAKELRGRGVRPARRRSGGKSR